jgi:large subunit ribosomal protein L18
MNNVNNRLRRARKTRAKIAELKVTRLSVHRTNTHIYAQIIAESGDKVIVSASTVEADVRKKVKNGGNVEAAALIGKLIAEKAVKAGVTTVAFDRSGYKYHGRIKALADAARENGLSF